MKPITNNELIKKVIDNIIVGKFTDAMSFLQEMDYDPKNPKFILTANILAYLICFYAGDYEKANSLKNNLKEFSNTIEYEFLNSLDFDNNLTTIKNLTLIIKKDKTCVLAYIFRAVFYEMTDNRIAAIHDYFAADLLLDGCESIESRIKFLTSESPCS